MIDLTKLQKEVYDNKVAHNFNVTNIEQEFRYLMGETAEAFAAYKHETKDALAEEFADIAIYLLGLAEITGIDLQSAILKKMEKNRRRRYVVHADGRVEKIEDAVDE